jgi:hypothetical protein
VRRGAGTTAQGRTRGGGGRSKGACREGKGEGERERAHLGIQKPAITVTGSPRAKRWERDGREVGGGCCAGNKMR